MNIMKRMTLLLAVLCAASCGKTPPIENDADQPQASNGLSATLVLSVADSDTHARVIHPRLLLRNESSRPVRFLKCVYNAGTFEIRTADGRIVQNSSAPRSGGQGAEVVTINPSETAEFDAYDYGWGLSQDTNAFMFNTSSLQAELPRGEYVVNYSLTVDEASISKMLKSYDWITDEPSALWQGQLVIRNTEMILR